MNANSARACDDCAGGSLAGTHSIRGEPLRDRHVEFERTARENKRHRATTVNDRAGRGKPDDGSQAGPLAAAVFHTRSNRERTPAPQDARRRASNVKGHRLVPVGENAVVSDAANVAIHASAVSLARSSFGSAETACRGSSETRPGLLAGRGGLFGREESH
jgi:hypothetical protein